MQHAPMERIGLTPLLQNQLPNVTVTKGRKREKSKQTKDDKQEDKESEDNTTDAETPQLTQSTSPKRSNKIKVDRDILTTHERTRSQSRLKMFCQS